MQIELIWQRDCPNVDTTRANLLSALSQTGQPARWREWCLDDAHCPQHARQFGSPTLLINGKDVGGLIEGSSPCCRVYPTDSGNFVGAIPIAQIVHALPTRDGSTANTSWRRLGSALPTIGVALLPKVACPGCWPAYAGVLSSLGLTALIDTTYLLALTTIFLGITLVALGFRAQRRRGYGPLFLGIFASTLLILGKFTYESDTALYFAVVLLMAASAWNALPRTSAFAGCPACQPQPASVSPCCAQTHKENK